MIRLLINLRIIRIYVEVGHLHGTWFEAKNEGVTVEWDGK